MRFVRTICLSLMCLAGLIALSAPAIAVEATKPTPRNTVAGESAGLAYLESRKGKVGNYLAPSELDERFTTAIYVNANGRGRNAQRMWVLQRDEVTGKFKLAMWDKKWWKSKRAKKKYGLKKGEVPPFSWLVSTGKKWRGDKKSGPTSLGVFAIDERKGRMQRGWHSRGMIHAMYIDLHYRSGRRSGIAFHGTTRGQYRKLGRIASHGCIRMHQTNALNLLKRIRGTDGVLSKEKVWGEVPRFWKYEKSGRRYGYVRDGSLLMSKRPASAVSVSTTGGADQPEIEADPTVLTKTGFRAVVVIFRD